VGHAPVVTTNVTLLSDDNALFLLGSVSRFIATNCYLLKRRKENETKKKKKVWEESCFRDGYSIRGLRFLP
jgi:hypothetical protein